MQLLIFDLAMTLLLTIVCYLASNSFLVAGVVGGVSAIYFFLIFNSKFNKYWMKSKRFHECFNFINTFIVSLSVTNSLALAFERTTVNISNSLKKELTGIENLAIDEKISYLRKYFPFHIYELFINIINLFIEQGGNILDMSRYLLKEARMIEEYINGCYSIVLKRVVEIAILWASSFLLLIFVRFGLSQFFETLSSKAFYPASIGVFFGFVLISIDISLKCFLDLDIQGFKGYEKVKSKIKQNKR